jgi:hypothetical protein
MSVLVEVSCCVYRLLLRVQPEGLRARYGAEMEVVFREQMSAARDQGASAVARLWVSVTRETVVAMGPGVAARGGVLAGSVAGSAAMMALALVGFCTVGPITVAHGSSAVVTVVVPTDAQVPPLLKIVAQRR